MDTIGLLPLLPSIGAVRHAGKLGAAGDVGRYAHCGINSFTAGTLVHSEQGLIPIEQVTLGTQVYAQDPQSGEAGFYEVVAVFSHPTDELLAVTLDTDNPDKPIEVMEVTLEHPIYVEGKGWLAAQDLALGDRLRRQDGGWATVLSIDQVLLSEPVLVYNFTLKGLHTYFVLEVGVLVHNCGYADLIKQNNLVQIDYRREHRLIMQYLTETGTDVSRQVYNNIKAGNFPLYYYSRNDMWGYLGFNSADSRDILVNVGRLEDKYGGHWQQAASTILVHEGAHILDTRVGVSNLEREVFAFREQFRFSTKQGFHKTFDGEVLGWYRASQTGGGNAWLRGYVRELYRSDYLNDIYR